MLEVPKLKYMLMRKDDKAFFDIIRKNNPHKSYKSCIDLFNIFRKNKEIKNHRIIRIYLNTDIASIFLSNYELQLAKECLDLVEHLDSLDNRDGYKLTPSIGYYWGMLYNAKTISELENFKRNVCIGIKNMSSDLSSNTVSDDVLYVENLSSYHKNSLNLIGVHLVGKDFVTLSDIKKAYSKIK